MLSVVFTCVCVCVGRGACVGPWPELRPSAGRCWMPSVTLEASVWTQLGLLCEVASGFCAPCREQPVQQKACQLQVPFTNHPVDTHRPRPAASEHLIHSNPFVVITNSQRCTEADGTSASRIWLLDKSPDTAAKYYITIFSVINITIQ